MSKRRRVKQLLNQKESEAVAADAKRIVREAMIEAERVSGISFDRFCELQYKAQPKSDNMTTESPICSRCKNIAGDGCPTLCDDWLVSFFKRIKGYLFADKNNLNKYNYEVGHVLQLQEIINSKNDVINDLEQRISELELTMLEIRVQCYRYNHKECTAAAKELADRILGRIANNELYDR